MNFLKKKPIISASGRTSFDIDPEEMKAAFFLLNQLAQLDAYSPQDVRQQMQRVSKLITEQQHSGRISDAEAQAALMVARRIGTCREPIEDLLKKVTDACVGVASKDTFPAVYNRMTADLIQGKALSRYSQVDNEINPYRHVVQVALEQTYAIENPHEINPTIRPVRGYQAFRQSYNKATNHMLELAHNIEEFPRGNSPGMLHYTAAVQEFNNITKSHAGLFGTTPTDYQLQHTQGMMRSLEKRESREEALSAMHYDYFLGEGGVITRLDKDLRNPIIVAEIGDSTSEAALEQVSQMRQALLRAKTGIATSRFTHNEKEGYTVSPEGSAVAYFFKERVAKASLAIADVAEMVDAGIGKAAALRDTNYPRYDSVEIQDNVAALIAATSALNVQQKQPYRGR